jgi:hypothetical protein
VCRIEEGSTNAYLMRDRAIEEFLTEVEPRYNASLAKLRENKMDQEAIASLSGFAAYIVACSPTAMRLFNGTFMSGRQGRRMANYSAPPF